MWVSAVGELAPSEPASPLLGEARLYAASPEQSAGGLARKHPVAFGPIFALLAPVRPRDYIISTSHVVLQRATRELPWPFAVIGTPKPGSIMARRQPSLWPSVYGC
jgi:hypothetical protein